MNLVEDAEDLVRINRAQGQIIVGIAAIVEMEAAQHAGVQQPRHDLLDILRGIVMAGIHQHPGLRASLGGQVRCHAPVGDVGVIKSGLEGLVLDQQPLVGPERAVRARQRLFQPLDPLADALRAGVVRAVGQPQRNVARTQVARDRYRIQHVLNRPLPDLGRWVAERAELVFLILKKVGIDRAR